MVDELCAASESSSPGSYPQDQLDFFTYLSFTL